VGAGFVIVNSLVPLLVSPRSTGPRASDPYESGEVPVGSAWIRFDVYYYLFALIFLVFDVEAVFLFPVLIAYHAAPGLAAFAEMALFLGILSFVILYAWKKGIFEWR
jgi:NADH-quinone oxidoreductase subunit A